MQVEAGFRSIQHISLTAEATTGDRLAKQIK